MKRFGLLIAMLALVAAACSSASDIANEQILENIEGVEDVDIDSSTGEINVVSEDGSLSIGSGDIPDELTVAVPDGGKAQASFVSDDGVSVVLEYPESDYQRVVDFYSSWTDSHGGEWEYFTQSFESSNGTINSESWSLDADINIVVTTCPSTSGDSAGSQVTCVTILEE